MNSGEKIDGGEEKIPISVLKMELHPGDTVLINRSIRFYLPEGKRFPFVIEKIRGAIKKVGNENKGFQLHVNPNGTKSKN